MARYEQTRRNVWILISYYPTNQISLSARLLVSCRLKKYGFYGISCFFQQCKHAFVAGKMAGTYSEEC